MVQFPSVICTLCGVVIEMFLDMLIRVCVVDRVATMCFDGFDARYRAPESQGQALFKSMCG